MIPILFITNNEEQAEKCIADFASKLQIAPSHRIVVKPEKEELTVDQIHQMKKDIQYRFSSQVLVALVGVDASSTEVQNSLLKCLEEEAERIQFLLLVKNPLQLLSTIRSRSTLYHDNSSPSTQNGELPDLSVVFSFKENTDATKEIAVQRIDSYIKNSGICSIKILSHILTIRKLISDNNMNPLLGLDNILIFLSKQSTMNVIHEKK